MMVFFSRFFLVIALWCGLPATGNGAAFFREPENFEQLDFYLHTVDVGPELFMVFGHTAIRMVDPSNGVDLVLNWGIFDFDPLFPIRFYKGELLYSFAIYPMQTGLNIYRREGRTVWQDKLNLTVAQKRAFFAKIQWNASPENRKYLYDFYWDNCSTRIRDYLDLAIGGKFKERYVNVSTGEDFRITVQTHMANQLLVQAGLEVLMNDVQEQVMTAWDKMFLPSALRQYLLEMPAFDDNGKPIAGEKLLVEDRVLIDFSRPTFQEVLGLQWLAWIFSTLTLASLLAWTWKRPRFLRIYGLFSLLWGLAAGTLGFLMFVSWTYSSIAAGKHNINLLLFWPIDYVFVYIGYKYLRHGQVVWRRPTWLRTFYGGHLLAIAVHFLGWAAGWYVQDTTQTLMYLAPGDIAVALLGLAALGHTRRARP